MKILLGQRLKDLRTEHNLTQREMAELFHINSVTYLHYEKDQRQPPLELLVLFARHFGVSVDYLLGMDELP